jgi:hypothetical protein
MKKSALILALLLSTAAAGVIASPGAPSRAATPPEHESRAQKPTLPAEAFLENFWGREHHGERHGHHARHSDDDEDDDDDHGGHRHGRNGGAKGQADPNAANTPVPDNGVFKGKARPKVEVQ